MSVPKEQPENVVDFVQATRSTEPDDDGHNVEDLPKYARLRAQVSAGREFITALGELTIAIDDDADEAQLLEVLDHALEKVIRATSATDGALLVKDDDSKDLVFALAWGKTPRSELIWKRIPAGQGVAQWVAQNRRPAIVNNATSDERFYKGIDIDNDFRTQSILAAPIIDGQKVLGVIEVLNKKDGAYFTLGDQNHLTLLAHLAALTLTKMGKSTA